MRTQLDTVQAALGLIKLLPLMQKATGSPELVVGMIDGPVDLTHSAFAGARIQTVRPQQTASCSYPSSSECLHGTAVAGILFADREAPAPAICPDCAFLLYPLFAEQRPESSNTARTTPGQLSRAILETVDAGAKLINLSLGVITSDVSAYRELDDACEYAFKHGVLLVAAAGNQGHLGFLPLLNHPWIIPVAACDAAGRPTPESNLSPSIGARGFLAPGVNVSTTAPSSQYSQVSGTSVAAAFVSGGLALLWSEYPQGTASEIRQLALQPADCKRRSIVPRLFDAAAAARGFTRSH